MTSSHNDPETVRGALDFALITNESLLASIPKYEPLLVATCSEYTQYAFGFIQPDAEALQFDDFEKSQVISARAFRLALRGRDYCWRALEVRFKGITPLLKADAVDGAAQGQTRAGPAAVLVRGLAGRGDFARRPGSSGVDHRLARSSGRWPSARLRSTRPGTGARCMS